MNKRVVRRLLDTFFRRRWLYLTPVILFTLLGIASFFRSGSGYQSVGVIDVANGTVLSELTSLKGDQKFGFETPSASTAKAMTSLIGTDNFVDSIAKAAGVTGALQRGELSPVALRSAIAVTTDGDNLVQISATTNNPELSSRLAQGTIDSFMEYVVSGDEAESTAAEKFFNAQLKAYQSQLEQAQTALRDYATTHPGGPQDLRPLDEQVEIERLKSAVQSAQDTFTAAQQKSDEARLASEQSRSDVAQQLRVIDKPKVPTAPMPRLIKGVITVVLFMFVGGFLSVGAVVVASALDRSLRSAEDVEQLLDLPVLAVVPDGQPATRGRRGKKEKKKGKATEDVSVPSTRTPTRSADLRPSAERARSVKGGATVSTRPATGARDTDGRRPGSTTTRTEGAQPRGQRGDPH